MRVLFDHNVPAPLARLLVRHTVRRSSEFGWSQSNNGTLIRAAEDAGFDVLISCDQNLQYQQNFRATKLAVVLLSTNHWPTLKPRGSRLATTVDFAQRGQVIFFDVHAE